MSETQKLDMNLRIGRRLEAGRRPESYIYIHIPSQTSDNHTIYLPHWIPKGSRAVLNFFFLNKPLINSFIHPSARIEPTLLVHCCTDSLIKMTKNSSPSAKSTII